MTGLIDQVAHAMMESRGVRKEDRVDGMIAVFRRDAEAALTVVQPALDALQAIADGNEPRPRAQDGVWRADGRHSQHDLCIHGKSLKVDCGVCVADFARDSLMHPTSQRGRG